MNKISIFTGYVDKPHKGFANIEVVDNKYCYATITCNDDVHTYQTNTVRQMFRKLGIREDS